MFQVTYYLNKIPHSYNFCFNTLWGAIFKARTIFEEHGLFTDVVNTRTGEILAIFSATDVWTDNDLEIDLQVLAHKSLE